jgi:phosphopentomutase
MKRVIIIVLDSAGIGELPDAAVYGDEGSNTLGNIAAAVEGFSLPNLEKLGLGHIDGVKGYKPVENPIGCYGRMIERSAGKDTTTGHWEIAGIILEKPFPVYPHGFPEEILKQIEDKIGTKTIGNYAASGTEIINKLGQQHVMTGFPIVYTSADSVFQVAAHEEIIPVGKLYEICMTAREILTGDYAVGRVIARPFKGTEGNFTRTVRRRDFSLKPMKKTILDYIMENGMEVKAVGKIEDIFAGQGITESVHTDGNTDGIEKTLAFIRQRFDGLVFTNLVEFDMLYGHRNNARGYAEALLRFDERIPEILEALHEQDILMMTADHGCDPTTGSTDHSREYVPLLVYGKWLRSGINLGTRRTFSDIARTVADILGIDASFGADSFYKDVIL